MAKKIFVISNSHLDPIWIWNRRSGRCAWINTMHSVIHMMERHPELKFTCSASAQYRWLEENEPSLFRKIARFVEQERWEIVGGWEVQSDAIIARAESLLRQGMVGKEYFRRKFGVDINIGYCVDSFGHGAGLPKLLNAVGITHYVAMRPMVQQMQLPPLFDWKADDGSTVRLLHIFDSYNGAGSTYEEFQHRIERNLENPLEYLTLFFGVGDHGGGIYEEHMKWIDKAAGKYDISYSTLHDYFEAVKEYDITTVTGELGNVFRGCYSACHEVKRQIAYALDRVQTAEKIGLDAAALDEPWKELLFNHFHDILPGTSIMEAYRDDIYPGIGSVIHQANFLIDRTLSRRVAAEDTTFMPEGGLYIRNTEPHTVRKMISVTGFADPNQRGVLFNALKNKKGETIPLQLLPPPTMFGPCGLPWGNLTAIVDMAPNEEKFLAYAVEKNPLPKLGFSRQKKVLEKLGFQMFHDDHGTWGFTLEKYLHPMDSAVLLEIEEIADGPVASILRATYRLGTSKIQADLLACKDIPEICIKLMINWQEPYACLKMTYDHRIDNHIFATGAAAASVVRFRNGRIRQKHFCENDVFGPLPQNSCEVPMIDWCAAYSNDGRGAAFYAADIHGCDHADGLLRITLLRSTLFADHHPFDRNEQTGCQEIGISFIDVYLSEESSMNERNLPKRAVKCLKNVEVLEVTCHTADPDAFEVAPPSTFVNELPEVITQSVRKNENGEWEIHLMNYGDETMLRLPSGKEIFLPSCKLTIISA